MSSTSNELGELHKVVANVLSKQVGQIFEEKNEEGVIVDRYYAATPALLTVAARFLKDNDITCEIEDSKGMSDLQAELDKRKKGRGKLTDISALLPEAASG